MNILNRYKINHIIMLALIFFLNSCMVKQRHPVPAPYVTQAQVVGFPNVRTYGHKYSPLFQADFVDALKAQIEHQQLSRTQDKKKISILAISGGGADGAFGSGILNGWTASKKRPKFTIVSGISTGSLIAPFAFLGSKYDDSVKKAYTSITAENIYTKRSILSILSGADSFADSQPLAKLIASYIDDKTLKLIAREYRKGRRLYIGTTNIDYHKLIVWNMGAIAASNKKDSLELFRKILLASASIPVAFPPVKIPVIANNKIYDELHVDGGVTTEVFFYGFILDFNKALKSADFKHKPEISAYIIRNNQILSPYKPVKQSLLSIGGKALTGLTRSQGVGDLYRIYTAATREGVNYNLVYIPDNYVTSSDEPFNKKEMLRLYQLGYSIGKRGNFWMKEPPFLN